MRGLRRQRWRSGVLSQSVFTLCAPCERGLHVDGSSSKRQHNHRSVDTNRRRMLQMERGQQGEEARAARGGER
jgi:hypothetical protein